MIFLGADSGTDMFCEKCTILDIVGSAKPRWNFTKKHKTSENSWFCHDETPLLFEATVFWGVMSVETGQVLKAAPVKHVEKKLTAATKV